MRSERQHMSIAQPVVTARDITAFPGGSDQPIGEVGGKAGSLIQLSRKGLPVPPGLVLKVGFFAEWFAQLKSSREWAEFRDCTLETAPAACAKLKQKSVELRLSDAQLNVLESAVKKFSSATLFAVRSSSPEEDLEGFSFAGGYETVLGARKQELESAIRRCFASCLDERIFAYKAAHGIDPHDPKIAVIVQQQLDSDVAGVGFSINPVTNDFDEAVITANFGQGETVVSGVITPDTFVVDKAHRRVKQRTLGSKATIVRLKSDGGTETVAGTTEAKMCITDRQARKIADLIARVEKIYGKPVDIEWALARSESAGANQNQELYLLQARPVTSYQPLPPNLVTAPGARRRLYLDGTKAGQGIMEPFTVMGSSFIEHCFGNVAKRLYGLDLVGDIDRTHAFLSNGCIYLNISVMLRLMGKQKLANLIRIVDPLAAETILALPLNEYISNDFGYLLALPLKIAQALPVVAPRMLRSYLRNKDEYQRLQSTIENYRKRLAILDSADISMSRLMKDINQLVMNLIIADVLALFLLSRLAIEQMKKLVPPEKKHLAELLTHSLPNNVTVDMGLALFDLARLLPTGINVDELIRALKERTLSDEFLTKWDQFIALYGHRGPRELDIESVRYGEDYSFLAHQLIALQSADEKNNPRTRHDKSVAEREAAYEEVNQYLSTTNPARARKFRARYRLVLALGGMRETPKYCIILAQNTVRRHLLKQADQWVKEGRLQERNEIFGLTLEDVYQAARDKQFDMEAAIRKHAEYRSRYKVQTLPKFFDSRGRIIHPPAKPAGENEIQGTPVSAGITQGTVKVLLSPNEKPLKAGDIMVTRATDPGWTPLFTVAGAVVLEIGGILQHGALVAREYGLPCVSGVEGATERLKDGMRVEVNGMTGVIKILSD